MIALSLQDIGLDLPRAQGDLRNAGVLVEVQGDFRAGGQDDAAAVAEQQADEGGRRGLDAFQFVDVHAFFQGRLVALGVELPGVAGEIEHAGGFQASPAR